MSYRVHEHPKHTMRRTVEAITTPMKVFITNGAIAHVAFPCYYQEIVRPHPVIHHHIHWHHHVGWPTYNHPDHICQMAYKPHECGHRGPCDKTCRHYLDASTIFPIHFLDHNIVKSEFGIDDPRLTQVEYNALKQQFPARYPLTYAQYCAKQDALLANYENAKIERYLETCEVVFWTEDGDVDGIETAAYIDPLEDWVVRVDFQAAMMEALKKPRHHRFTVFANAPAYTTEPVIDARSHEAITRTYPARRDVVGLGELIIMPSGYVADEDEQE